MSETHTHHAHGGGAHGLPDDMVLDQAFWDERYRSTGERTWSGNPNPQLVAEVSGLTPGSALDVGAGEGADAVWLAERGWRVTGADISVVALERAAAHAAAAGPEVAARIAWLHADLIEQPPAADAFDLVSAQFMQLPSEQRGPLYRRLAEAVAPGGTLLIVGHHPDDMGTTVPRPAMPDLFFTAEQLAAGLDPGRWTIEVQEARGRETRDPEGRPVVIHDAVLRARRTG